jgi:hypothetical protein
VYRRWHKQSQKLAMTRGTPTWPTPKRSPISNSA